MIKDEELPESTGICTGMSEIVPKSLIVRAAGIPEIANLEMARNNCSECTSSAGGASEVSTEDRDSHKASTACRTSGAQR